MNNTRQQYFSFMPTTVSSSFFLRNKTKNDIYLTYCNNNDSLRLHFFAVCFWCFVYIYVCMYVLPGIWQAKQTNSFRSKSCRVLHEISALLLVHIETSFVFVNFSSNNGNIILALSFLQVTWPHPLPNIRTIMKKL